jgi:predicted secreted Zn-dependent protease
LLAHSDDAEIRYYDVFGTTGKEIRREINLKGPIGKRGKPVDGRTQWHVGWKYRYSPSAGGCQFTRIEVTLTGVITLPRWANERPTGTLTDQWRRYLAALRRHEDGHYANGRRAAEEIEALGRSFRIADRCSAIAQAFKEQAHSIMEKYNAADRAYDLETRHGRTEGVKFP